MTCKPIHRKKKQNTKNQWKERVLQIVICAKNQNKKKRKKKQKKQKRNEETIRIIT